MMEDTLGRNCSGQAAVQGLDFAQLLSLDWHVENIASFRDFHRHGITKSCSTDLTSSELIYSTSELVYSWPLVSREKVALTEPLIGF